MIAERSKPIGRARRHVADSVFKWVCRSVGALSVVVLVVLIAAIIARGMEYLDAGFLTSPPHYEAERAGFMPAILGSVWLCAIVIAVGVPVGVGAAIYLHEFAPRSRVTSIIQINIANLAGVPSVVYGLIGLSAFVGFWNLFGSEAAQYRLLGGVINIPFGRTVLSGGLTLTLLVLPIIIIAAQEALRAVPDSQREAARALGATPWQTVRRAVFPIALPGMMTGSILALSRAIGETAPILVAGAAVIHFSAPDSLMDSYTAMPALIYYWADQPERAFQSVAASGILVLLFVLLVFNSAAIFIRARAQRRLTP
ncbi:MAG: phosphate ABC transporter permease PstA [Phycisphaerales bacterium]